MSLQPTFAFVYGVTARVHQYPLLGSHGDQLFLRTEHTLEQSIVQGCYAWLWRFGFGAPEFRLRFSSQCRDPCPLLHQLIHSHNQCRAMKKKLQEYFPSLLCHPRIYPSCQYEGRMERRVRTASGAQKTCQK